jgi:NADH dehydrogenase (ubiquinone) Fe-S protein 1
VPLQRVGGDFQEIGWEKALNLAASKIAGARPEEICGSVGELSDLETLTALRDLVFRLGGECF